MDLRCRHDVFLAAVVLQQRSDLLLQASEQQAVRLQLVLPQQRRLLENLHLTRDGRDEH